MLKPPVLRGGSSEAKSNFGSAPLLFTEVDDSAILFLTVDDISQDEFLTQSDRCRQSNETTMSTKHKRPCGKREWIIVGRLAFDDHRQLRAHPL